MGPRWAQHSSTWAQLGPTWAQPALNIGPASFRTGNHCALCLPQFNIAFPGFARRISAPSSHTMSQTSLLGRRPAVRRKPLDPGAGHGLRPCRRPSVVTEVYRGCCPAALRCILLAVLKNIVFLRCFGRFGGKEFHLGDVKNISFYVVLGCRMGPRAEKLAS